MTKQEVQDNIRYNENLVNQYQWEIRNLNDKIRSLTTTARALSGQIDALQKTKQQLEKEIAELRQLKQKLTGLRDSFARRQAQRLSNFNKHTGLTTVGLKLFTSYLNGMRDLLSGQEYRKTYDGLSDAIEKTDKKLRAKERERDSVQREINSRKQRLDSTNRDLSNSRNRLNQRNSDLSYRRGRIRYWQDQLKYAT